MSFEELSSQEQYDPMKIPKLEFTDHDLTDFDIQPGQETVQEANDGLLYVALKQDTIGKQPISPELKKAAAEELLARYSDLKTTPDERIYTGGYEDWMVEAIKLARRELNV